MRGLVAARPAVASMAKNTMAANTAQKKAACNGRAMDRMVPPHSRRRAMPAYLRATGRRHPPACRCPARPARSGGRLTARHSSAGAARELDSLPNSFLDSFLGTELPPAPGDRPARLVADIAGGRRLSSAKPKLLMFSPSAATFSGYSAPHTPGPAIGSIRTSSALSLTAPDFRQAISASARHGSRSAD